MKYMETGLSPSRQVAGILLCGILSDTLALRSSTTTHQDKRAVRFLAPIAGETRKNWALHCLGRGWTSPACRSVPFLPGTPNFLPSRKKTVQIAQVMVPSFAWNRERDEAIYAALEKARSAAGADFSLALFTNVLENASDLYGAGDAVLLRGLFGEKLPARLPGVMSRKKDFLPWLGEKLRNLGRA